MEKEIIIDISSDDGEIDESIKKRVRVSEDEEIEFIKETERKIAISPNIICMGLLGCYLVDLKKDNIDFSKSINEHIAVKISIQISELNTYVFSVVDSLDSKLIGYLPEEVGKALSPFTRTVKISSRMNVKDPAHIYIKLILFAQETILPNVSYHFKQMGLSLFAPDENVPFRYVNPTHSSFNLNAQFASRYQENDQVKLLNQTNSRVEELYKSFTSPQNLEEMEQDHRLKTKLLKYQRQALSWLYIQEQESKTDDDIIFWKKEGKVWRNMITDTICETKPKKIRGGILADDMGLGKTIQSINILM